MPDSPITLRSLVHPHQIEVQDFASYALVIDARSSAEYAQDHIPGAIHLPAHLAGADQLASSTDRSIGEPAPSMPYALTVATAHLNADDAVLVYCARGGLDSVRWAEPLRRAGRTVDVLGGGWPNYRNWVQAGLEALPRAMNLRCLCAPPVGGLEPVLPALQDLGEQVIDLCRLAGQRLVPGMSLRSDAAPSQAAFESVLLDALRQVDPEQPTWLAVPVSLEALQWPPTLADRWTQGRTLRIHAPASQRARAWLDVQPAPRVAMTILLDELQHGKSQPPSALTESCTRESRAGDPVVALTMLLEHFLDGAYAGANLAAAFDVIELETLDLPAVRAALAACIPPAEGQIRP